MTPLQAIKAQFKTKYNVKATAENARVFLGYDIKGRGNTKVFWNEVAYRMYEEQQAQERSNRWREEFNKHQGKPQVRSLYSTPSEDVIIKAAEARGYSSTEAQVFAVKALAAFKASPKKAQRLYFSRLSMNVA